MPLQLIQGGRSPSERPEVSPQMKAVLKALRRHRDMLNTDGSLRAVDESLYREVREIARH